MVGRFLPTGISGRAIPRRERTGNSASKRERDLRCEGRLGPESCNWEGEGGGKWVIERRAQQPAVGVCASGLVCLP
jgi:hypothetical protein